MSISRTAFSDFQAIDKSRERIDAIKRAIEKHKRAHVSGYFTAIPTQAIEKRLLVSPEAPMIIFQGGPGDHGVPAGETFIYTLGIHNPGLTAADCLFAQVWVGNGHADPFIGTFLLNCDPRFPKLTEPPAVEGLCLSPGATMALNFSIPVPARIEKSLYFLNVCLMRSNWNDAGQYLDRGSFPLIVS